MKLTNPTQQHLQALNDANTLDTIAEAAAVTMNASLYADACERAYEDGTEPPGPSAGAGEDWIDYAPEPSPHALAAVRAHLAATERGLANAGLPEFLVHYNEWATRAKRDPLDTDAMERFGHAWAMESMGHGVSPADSVSETLRTPREHRYQTPSEMLGNPRELWSLEHLTWEDIEPLQN